MQLTSLLYRVLADVPPMVVDAHQASVKLFLADGIERARDGLGPLGLASVAGALQRAEAAVVDGVAVVAVGEVLVAGKYAVFSAHNARHQVAVGIRVGHALLVDDALGRCGEILPHGVERFLNRADFIERYGCSGVAFHAACALAFVEVAAKLLGKDIGRNQYVANLYDVEFGSSSVVVHECYVMVFGLFVRYGEMVGFHPSFSRHGRVKQDFLCSFGLTKTLVFVLALPCDGCLALLCEVGVAA